MPTTYPSSGSSFTVGGHSPASTYQSSRELVAVGDKGLAGEQFRLADNVVRVGQRPPKDYWAVDARTMGRAISKYCKSGELSLGQSLLASLDSSTTCKNTVYVPPAPSTDADYAMDTIPYASTNGFGPSIGVESRDSLHVTKSRALFSAFVLLHEGDEDYRATVLDQVQKDFEGTEFTAYRGGYPVDLIKGSGKDAVAKEMKRIQRGNPNYGSSTATFL